MSNPLEREHHYYLLGGRALCIAERILEIAKGGPRLKEDEIREMHETLSLFHSYNQNFGVQGGPEIHPVFPSLECDPKDDTLYLRCPVEQDTGRVFVPPESHKITDPAEIRRLDILFAEGQNTVFTNTGFHLAQESPAPAQTGP